MIIDGNRAGPRGLRLALLALPIAALTLAAGCSGSSTGRQVANLPGGSGHGTGTTTLTQAQADQDFVNYAHCMRAHGVQMRDPFHRPGHTGLSIEVPAETSANRPAFEACQHFVQPVVNMKNAHAQAFFGPLLHALTRYAECMRSHDIAMLDPTPEGQLNLGTNDVFGRNSPQFRAADTACRHFLPASVPDNGTGP